MARVPTQARTLPARRPGLAQTHARAAAKVPACGAAGRAIQQTHPRAHAEARRTALEPLSAGHAAPVSGRPPQPTRHGHGPHRRPARHRRRPFVLPRPAARRGKKRPARPRPAAASASARPGGESVPPPPAPPVPDLRSRVPAAPRSAPAQSLPGTPAPRRPAPLSRPPSARRPRPARSWLGRPAQNNPGNPTNPFPARTLPAPGKRVTPGGSGASFRLRNRAWGRYNRRFGACGV